MKSKLQELEQRIEDLTKEYKKTVSTYEKRFKTLQEKNKRLFKKAKLLQNRNKRLEGKVEHLTEENKRLERKVEHLTEENKQLQEENKQLRVRIKFYESPHQPSSKKLSTEKKKTTSNKKKKKTTSNKKGGSKKGKKGSFWNTPDKVEHHFVRECRCCGKGIPLELNTWTKTKTTLDIPREIPVTVTEHHLYAGQCSSCQNKTLSPEPTLEDTAIGTNLLVFFVTLRARTGASYEQLQAVIYDFTGKKIGTTTIYRGVVAMSKALTPVADDIGRDVINSTWIHADETSHVLIDENGRQTIWVWVFCTPTTAFYHLSLGRKKAVVETVLDTYLEPGKPPPIAVTDVYGAYTNTFKVKQLCWPHGLRDADELGKCCQDGKHLASKMRRLYAKCKYMQQALRKKGQQRISRPLYRQLVGDIQTMVEIETDCPDVKTMQKRLRTKGEQYLTGLRNTNIPLTNNHAERCLRQVVVNRKQGKPLRSQDALQHYGTLLTLYVTLQLRSIPVAPILRNYINVILTPTIVPSDVS